MKIQKLIWTVAAGLLIATISGEAAMATGCGDGVLQNESFDGNLIVSNEFSCSIISSEVQGDIIVRDTDNILLLNNKVGGSIRVFRTDGEEGVGIANVIANTVFTGILVVNEHEIANVIENETLTSNIRVIGNTDALAQKNISGLDLVCRGNTVADAFFNFAKRNLVDQCAPPE